jgi:hypothetical protein
MRSFYQSLGDLSRLPAWVARAALLGWALLCVDLGGASTPAPTAAATAEVDGQSDLALYQAIAARVRAGEPYYPVVGSELRTRGYATRPFPNWRLPTLAWTLRSTPSDEGARGLLVALAGAGALSLILGFRRTTEPGPAQLVIVLLVGMAATVTLTAEAMWFHEVWAGWLVALSLGLHLSDRRGAAAVAALGAMLFREIAAVYAIAMAVAAFLGGDRDDLKRWAGALAGWGAALGAHAATVHLVHLTPDDLSKSWVAFGFTQFLAATASWNPLFANAPTWGLRLVWPTAWLGALGLGPRLAGPAFLVISAFAVVYSVLGNMNNDYWGLITAPLLCVGLAGAPRAFAGLLQASKPGTSAAHPPGE